MSLDFYNWSHSYRQSHTVCSLPTGQWQRLFHNAMSLVFYNWSHNNRQSHTVCSLPTGKWQRLFHNAVSWVFYIWSHSYRQSRPRLSFSSENCPVIDTFTWAVSWKMSNTYFKRCWHILTLFFHVSTASEPMSTVDWTKYVCKVLNKRCFFIVHEGPLVTSSLFF